MSLLAWLSWAAAGQSGVILDPNLEAACNCALGITGPPTALDLAGLSALDASERGITNLAGLELATNLTQLNLARNAIADVSPLGNLSGLAELSVEDNLITTDRVVAVG